MLLDKIKQSQLTQLNFSPKNLTWRSSWLCLTRDRARCPLAISNISLCQDPQTLPPPLPPRRQANIRELLTQESLHFALAVTDGIMHQHNCCWATTINLWATSKQSSSKSKAWMSESQIADRKKNWCVLIQHNGIRICVVFGTTEYVFVLYLAQRN